jgi:hypothetical protein
MNRMTRKRSSQVLQQQLGLERYNYISNLVTNVKVEKNELAGMACPKCEVKRGPKKGAFGEQLPGPVRDLFFNTPILDVFENYSLQRVAHINWDTLLTQAEKHLQAYNTWKAENYVCYRI